MKEEATNIAVSDTEAKRERNGRKFFIYMKTAPTFMNPYDRKGGFPTKPYWIKSPKSLRKTLVSSTTLRIAKSA
jgi:hypothetical protein